MKEAVERLLSQRESPGHVVVVGDYDVDGVSSTALVMATLAACGISAEAILPHRQHDGYGLQPQHVDRAVAHGATLLLTLDCGTSAHREIALAMAAGLETIVVDHHLPGNGPLPEAILINPQQPQCSYPYPELAAAGLSFKLCLALAKAAGRSIPVEALLRIACLGTIADMVPLTGENRVIAALGLDAMKDTRSLGLLALFRNARIHPPFDASDVGFRVGPRLNAAGRIGSADGALELLTTRDADRAEELAEELERYNSERRATETRVVEEVEERLAARGALPPILVEWDEGWHRGVVGIAASRISRKYRRPTLLLQVADGSATGSGRSVPGIQLFDFLAQWESEYSRFGGHAQAIGLSISMGRIEGLRERWEHAAEVWPEETRRRRYEYELEVEPGAVDHELYRDLARLEPYGMANPQPMVRIGPMQSEQLRPFGNGHLRIFARGRDDRRLSLLGWNWADRADLFNGEFEAIGFVELDRFSNRPELRLVEVRPCG
jgi:single-stranded-DNA-specific exonuclease